MARIMNQVGWIWKRFGKGDTVGGPTISRVWCKNIIKSCAAGMGMGRPILKMVAGKKIEDYEISSMFKASGIFSSWRNRAISFG
jgi:hypothetical protein